MDRYYSPAWLAQALSDRFVLKPGSRVFDPTMGAGALLQAADERVSPGNVLAMGCDIDSETVQDLQTERPDWMVGCADIYSEASRAECEVWASAKASGVDVVLMNPPFSFRGKYRMRVAAFGESFLLTPAVAALAIVLSEISIAQGLGIILPAGSLQNETNEAFWEFVRGKYDIQLVQELPRGSFPDAFASSALLTFHKRDDTRHPGLEALSGERPAESLRPMSEVCKCVEVIRGRVQTTSRIDQSTDPVPFIHTTNLREGQILPREDHRPLALSTHGPMLLLPRVGKFYFEKLVVTDSGPLVLSDCVLAIRASSLDALWRLRSVLTHPVTALDRVYGGTGAPYTTVRRIISKLEEVGWSALHVPASKGAFACRCSAMVSAKTAS